ncbi:MAG: hypothetical protein WA584_13685 [Pyrinomonadaceae bacterium]
MTELLEKAFAKASELPQDEQDLLAQSLLDDLAAEEKWDEAFANSQDALSSLADEALAEHRAGKTRRLEDVL